MSFVYFTKEKIITSEEKFSKDKIKELFNGIVIVRKFGGNILTERTTHRKEGRVI